MIRVRSFDVAAKRLQFLTNQFANLVQFGLQLHEARIVDHVLLHLLVFPRPHALQASERHPPNSQRLFARLLPSQVLIGVRGICRLALRAKLAVVIAARRSADCHHFATVTQTSVVPLSLHYIIQGCNNRIINHIAVYILIYSIKHASSLEFFGLFAEDLYAWHLGTAIFHRNDYC